MDNLDVGTGAKVYFRVSFFNGALAIDVTQTTVSLFAVSILLIIIGVICGRGLKKRPGRRQVLVEKGVSAVYDLVESTMGKHNAKYAPYIGTLFMTSLLGSLIGLTKIFLEVERHAERAVREFKQFIRLALVEAVHLRDAVADGNDVADFVLFDLAGIIPDLFLYYFADVVNSGLHRITNFNLSVSTVYLEYLIPLPQGGPF